MREEATIGSLREKIEAVDDDILRLLNKRAEIVLRIGKVKSKRKLNVYDPRREKAVLHRLASQQSGSFPKGALSPVFREIISACRLLEVNLCVVYLGPEATYTHRACLEHFGSSIDAFPKESIPDIFEAVERKEAAYGVAPVENSTEGSVHRTLDMFMESDVKICGEIMLRISHALLSWGGRSADVRRIYSHPQAFGQCRNWLRKNYPSLPLFETESTAKAAQMAVKDKGAAAIAGSFAAPAYGLKVIALQIEDCLHNYTRFLVLGREGAERTGRDKTSILFSIPHTPGTLSHVLQILCRKGINLTSIESRPARGKPWEYVFFVDMEGHEQDTCIMEALAALRGHVFFLKLLGSYPQASRDAV